jgi:hypothetical protein
MKIEREKEVATYWKIVSLETLIDRKGWKVSLLKGMYVAKLPTLIQVIWLKGTQLTYMEFFLMSFVVLVERGVKVN